MLSLVYCKHISSHISQYVCIICRLDYPFFPMQNPSIATIIFCPWNATKNSRFDRGGDGLMWKSYNPATGSDVMSFFLAMAGRKNRLSVSENGVYPKNLVKNYREWGKGRVVLAISVSNWGCLLSSLSGYLRLIQFVLLSGRQDQKRWGRD